MGPVKNEGKEDSGYWPNSVVGIYGKGLWGPVHKGPR